MTIESSEEFLNCLKQLFELTRNEPIKAILILIVIIVIFFLVLLIIEKLIMTFLTSIDQKKDYTNKDFKLLNREDQCRKEKYYAIDFWIWQKNKRVALDQHFQLGYKLSDGSTIVDKKIYTISVQKIFSSGYRSTRYKRELRIYTKYINEPSVLYGGDYVAGDKIGRDKITNSGIQINNIKNQLPYEIYEAIIKLSDNKKICQADRVEIKKYLKMYKNNMYSEQENRKLINILSRYIGVFANITSIIEFLDKIFK